MAAQRNKAVVSILLLVFILFIILIIFASYTVKALKDSSIELDQFDKDGQIAVVEVEGIILDSRTTIEKLIKSEKDKKIKAIILRINSPGGAVGPTQEIYHEIVRIDKKIPIYASFGSIAASGGYYLGAATRRIYSNAGTLTGSIGVIMHFMDLSKLYSFAKVNPSVIKSGKFKDVGSPSRSITTEEKALLQDIMDDVHKQFIDDILAKRKKKIKGNIWDLAQGQIFSGQAAYRSGLVDKIGSLWQAGRAIHKELKLSGEFGLKYIKNKKVFSVSDFLEKLDTMASNFNMKMLMNKAPMLLFNKD